MFCACSALVACLLCHDIQDLRLGLILALPLFVSGTVLKRRNMHVPYMLVHGLWHAVTAGLVWHAVWPGVMDLWQFVP
jgi:hypothetical protein